MTQRFETFTTAIAQIHRCIQRLKSQEMGELGLKGNHVACLFHLGRHPEGLTSAELCALCEEDKAAVSRTVAELESRGLLARSGVQRYRSLLTLTELGRETVEQMDERITRLVDAAGRGLTDAQRTDFYRVLLLVAANLQQICQEGAGE